MSTQAPKRGESEMRIVKTAKVEGGVYGTAHRFSVREPRNMGIEMEGGLRACFGRYFIGYCSGDAIPQISL